MIKNLKSLKKEIEEAISRINKAKRAILPKEVKKFNVEHVQMVEMLLFCCSGKMYVWKVNKIYYFYLPNKHDYLSLLIVKVILLVHKSTLVCHYRIH